jgi:Pentapeptide repeats (8 copies)
MTRSGTSKIDLTRTDLTRTDLTRTDLTRIDLTRIDLSRSDFYPRILWIPALNRHPSDRPAMTAQSPAISMYEVIIETITEKIVGITSASKVTLDWHGSSVEMMLYHLGFHADSTYSTYYLPCTEYCIVCHPIKLNLVPQ